MSKPRIYIDTSCFIDVISSRLGEKIEDGRDPEVDYVRRILFAAKKGELHLFTSALTIAECRYPKSKRLDDNVKHIIRSVLSSDKIVTLVEPTLFISEDARDLTWEHNIPKLSGADAIHIATAIERKCKEFLTVDEKVLKQSDIIKGNVLLSVIKPSTTTLLPAAYRQEKMPYENGLQAT